MAEKQIVACACNIVERAKILGDRHWNEQMVRQVEALGLHTSLNEEQGFIAQNGNYLTRAEAYQIVVKNKQVLHGQYAPPDELVLLMSEHLYYD